jgi:UDP-N-acetylmuramoyl-L-alanyl-D-glutamate--2,6-diaminopimelate ligase
LVAFADLVKHLDDINISGDPTTQINKVEVDSREIAPGDLFIAIDGYAADGLQYVPDAISKGAVAVLASKPFDADVPCRAIVRDARKAVSRIAAEFYNHPSRELTLIGVTGTNGKTTITYLIKSILSRQHGDAGLIGTLGYYSGKGSYSAINTTPGPLDLERMLREMRDAGLDIAVMEVSSHGLAMKRVEELDFNVVGISNITQDHLDFHADFDSYREAKAHLFDLTVGMDRWTILNMDDPSFEFLRSRVKSSCLTFSMESDRADFVANDVQLSTDGSSFTLFTPAGSTKVSLRLLGRFNVENALCSAALSHAAGAGLDSIVAGLEEQSSVHGRAERVDTGRDFTVLVDFAHTPDAIDKIGSTAREICRNRLIIVFGCGGDRDRTKRAPMGQAATRQADLVVVTSDNPRSEDPLKIIEDIKPGLNGSKEVLIEPDRRKAVELALSMCQSGDVLVVAGKGHEDYQLVGGKKFHFDDRQVIRDWLKRERV